MPKSKVKQDIIYIVIALIVVIGLYFLLQFIKAYNEPQEYVIVRNGRIINYEQDTAFIIRDEELVDTSEISNNIQVIVSDNNRVSKGGTIASYTVEDSTELKDKLKEIDSQIQELIKDVPIEYSQDYKTTEKNIENEIYNFIKYKDNLEVLSTRKKTIDELLEQKVKIISGFSSKGSDLDKLVKERESVEKEINKNKNLIKASRAGLVSYRVDGYEQLLSPFNFNTITVQQLKDIKYSAGQLIPLDTKKIKIINNFYAYLIIGTRTQEGKQIRLNDVIKFTLNNDLNSLNKGTVEYIINDGETRYLFIKTTDSIEKLTQYRTLNVNIVWWNYQGLRLPNNALYEDKFNDEFGNEKLVLKAISVQTNIGYTKKVWVKVENQAGGYSIVDNYTDQELIELGLNEEQIKDRSKLNLYDKVLLHT